MSFVGELKRRKVIRVGIAYLVASWLVLQVVDVVAPMLDLPNWVGRAILLMLAVGFVISLVLGWAYELTPEGVKREKDVDRSASVTAAKRRNTALQPLALRRGGERHPPPALPQAHHRFVRQPHAVIKTGRDR